MSFLETVNQVIAVLQTRGRVSYRVLKREFALDDEALEDLKEQLIDADRMAVDEDGKILVWVGGREAIAAPTTAPSQSRPPATYTPMHLAERIRAEQAALETRGALEEERKTITALFADIKGSMALMEDLDPEEARALVGSAIQVMLCWEHATKKLW